jgi:AmmeMemoRadiSam system protein B
MNAERRFRPPTVAGLFYPAEPQALSRTVRSFLEGKPTLPDPGPIGLITPHAGYSYSGPTAGRAFRELRDRPPEAVILLAPSHQDRFRGATVWPGAGYRTPLGDLPSPGGLVSKLAHESAGAIHEDRLGHRDEHAAEVQLPFLQEIAPEADVLPLVIADDHAERCAKLGEAIAGSIQARKVLLVASSDLYHGGSSQACRQTDARTLAALERNDPDEVAEGFGSGAFQACGRGPIMTVLAACRRLGARKVQVLAHTDSDEVTGRTGDYVVGYAAVAISRG